jgi:hypothetical protein
MFWFVDVVILCVHPAGEAICQRTSNRIGNEDTSKTADGEESELGRCEVIWCGGKERGRQC